MFLISYEHMAVFLETEKGSLDKSVVLSALRNELKITFPEKPSGGDSPGEWLVRAESSKERILHNKPFIPQKGQMGSSGVFFADNASSLMYPAPGVYYVFRTEDLQQRWVPHPSNISEDLVALIAKKYNLDLQTIGGGIEAESKLFEMYSIYQNRTGICTICDTVDPSRAHAILIHGNLMSDGEFLSLPRSIKSLIKVI